MRTKLLAIITITLLVVSNTGFAQKRTAGAIAFYNVENLFDTVDSPDTEDSEFTPTGKNEWTVERYGEKLANMAKVLSQVANGADIIGLAEVENLSVLIDLVAQPALEKMDYQIIHQDSPDYRGIDVGLLYRPGRFKILNYRAIPFPQTEETNFRTRDILHVTGLYLGDTLHVFVNHWPSRRGGKADKRILAGQQLRKEVEVLLNKNPQAKIVVMGDLNDDPINKSVKKELRAVTDIDDLENGDLFNTSAPTFRKGYGTLMYKGTWNLFDQIIVSQGLLSGNAGIQYQPESFSVFGPDFMRVKTGQFAGGPLRTFSFGVYQGGYSDHFPTYILIQK